MGKSWCFGWSNRLQRWQWSYWCSWNRL